jgi:hypothetical protein
MHSRTLDLVLRAARWPLGLSQLAAKERNIVPCRLAVLFRFAIAYNISVAVFYPAWQLLFSPESFNYIWVIVCFIVFSLINRILYIRIVGGEYIGFSAGAEKSVPSNAIFLDVSVLLHWIFWLIVKFEVFG